jgi:ADP-L-glycero-D-manno-heptose 6-epimerase
MVKVIVTGNEGFIGGQLFKTLEQLGYETHGIDEKYFQQDNWIDFLLKKINDITPDVIFHVGACSDTLEKDVDYMMTRNYESTKIIMDWCKEHKVPMIYSSSAANYGINGKYPSNLYGWSKYVAEGYVISNGGIALRYFNVYGFGEENKGKMASIAYQSYLKNKKNDKVYLFPKKPKRDFVYILDIISANLYAFENYNTLKGCYYEVGCGESKPFEDVLNLMNIKYEYLSEDLIPNGYQFYTCSNSEKYMKGWKPKWNIEKAIPHYKKILDTFI